MFDNYNQSGRFSTVKDFFPHRARIIITSRHNDIKRLGDSLEIGAMPADEAVELLLLQAGLEKTTGKRRKCKSNH